MGDRQTQRKARGMTVQTRHVDSQKSVQPRAPPAEQTKKATRVHKHGRHAMGRACCWFVETHTKNRGVNNNTTALIRVNYYQDEKMLAKPKAALAVGETT
jgi:hypothetical protein